MTELASPNGTQVAVRGPQEGLPPSVLSSFGLPDNFVDQMKFAEIVAKSDLVDKKLQGRPENVFMVVQKALGLNISFDLAIAQTHVIDNKVTPSAELLRILLRRAGHDLEIFHHDDKAAKATLTLAHRPNKPITMEYTIAKAQAAGLTGKPVWKQHAESMLVAAVTRLMVRFHCPEVAAGLDLSDDTAAVEFGDTPPVQAKAEVLRDPAAAASASVDEPADAGTTETGGKAAEILAEASEARDVASLTRLGKEARDAGLLAQVVGEDGRTLQQALMDRLAELESGATASKK